MPQLTRPVAQVSSAIEAQIIVGMLEANGIAATASSDDAGGLEPQWQLTQGVLVLVSADDETPARELIANAESGGDAAVEGDGF